jgi:hypothetical protein
MFICEILANMTQVSDVAPGPLVWKLPGFCFDFISPLMAKPKGTISLPSVCPSVRLSVIPLSVFRTFLCSGWRYSTKILYMTTSQWVTDQVWVSLRLTNFWLNYSLWCSYLVFRTFFCPRWSEESEIFYIASS